MADIIEDLTKYRISGIEKAEIEYYNQLTQALDRIEAQVVSLADKELPRQAGKLIELQSAVAIRPKIKQILEKEYLPFADRVVRKGFGEQAKRIERQFKTIGIIPPEFQELTKGDLALVQNLKQQYYTQFKDVSNNFTRILSDKVYQNTLVGTEFTELEQELRQSINGIYSTSRDPAVNRLVDYVKRNRDNKALESRVDSAIKILQTKYASTRTGENMKRFAGQILNDSLRDFDATLNFNKANDAGLTFVKYYGDVIPTTRDLCKRMVNGSLNKRPNGLFTIDEIKEIWRSRSWSGKKGGNPMIVRGGYNCRHQFSYVNPDWYEEDGEQSDILEKVTPIVKKEKGINISSFASPIIFSNIRSVPIKESKARINKTIQAGSADVRWGRNADGSFKQRFKNGAKYGDKLTVSGVSDKELTTVSVLLDELNDLAIKYNVPKLRGIRISPSKRYNMAMGDGVLYIDTEFLKRRIARSEQALENRKKGIPLSTKNVKQWKYGDDISKRPYTTQAYYSDNLDVIRNVMYHEFGHHIHQMKYVTATYKDKLGRLRGDKGFTPEIEEKISKILKEEKKKLPFNTQLQIGNSEYGDTNPREWFAEQFAVYSMGKLDKVHPTFKKLIKEIEDEVGR
jgi:hypothetical protein